MKIQAKKQNKPPRPKLRPCRTSNTARPRVSFREDNLFLFEAPNHADLFQFVRACWLSRNDGHD